MFDYVNLCPCSSTTLGDRAFVASAPKLWNVLPSDIRMAKSVDKKKQLKERLIVG